MALTLPFFLIATILMLISVQCAEFDVGGDRGWVVPSSNNDQEYNDWASSHRFRVNDTLRFEYKKDSVLSVTEEDYGRCRSSDPLFSSHNGHTVFTLDRSDMFYFISGVSGHCEKGLKMIVKVLEEEDDQVSDDQAPPKKNGAAALHFTGLESIVIGTASLIFASFFM